MDEPLTVRRIEESSSWLRDTGTTGEQAHMPRWLEGMLGRVSIAQTFFRFMWQQRLWWMVPLMVVLLLLGALLLVGQQTALAPFIYTLF